MRRSRKKSEQTVDKLSSYFIGPLSLKNEATEEDVYSLNNVGVFSWSVHWYRKIVT